ncbi:hypothetical protein DLAC_02097 [Tieghemostelium lacteum]|uniref:Uncharacterized protein n=1 Tax=Tieghemostelium lacteum TaxID=361077 RepID=A0A152A459_TIELA|nr:hypothetical protein DLAC_02097 [Tieghemostelium lacteum]|eukprot:KYR01016.1 hypothetical protein DLAC_02097 [Tieghemostelium lacteum]
MKYVFSLESLVNVDMEPNSKKSHKLNNTNNNSIISITSIGTPKETISMRLLKIFQNNDYLNTIIPIEKLILKYNLKMNRDSKLLVSTTKLQNKLNSNNNTTKIAKTELKMLKKYHWRLKSMIDSTLSEYPFIYSQNISKDINYHRFRPFLYLLLKPILNLDINNRWLMTIGNTLISILQSGAIKSPTKLELLLHQWGINEINSRKLIVLIWKYLNEKSITKGSSISKIILKCESEVKSNELNSVLYANCLMSALEYTKVSDKNLKQQQTQQITAIPNIKDKQQLNHVNWKDKKRKELNDMLLELNKKIKTS